MQCNMPKLAYSAFRSTRAATSPSHIMTSSNSTSPKARHQLAIQDESGEAAKALYGTTREEAIAGDLALRVVGDGLPVPHSTPSIDELVNVAGAPDQKVIDFTGSGNGLWTREEGVRASEGVVNDFANAAGIALYSAKSAVGRIDDESVVIKAVYGKTDDKGFTTIPEAIESTEYAL